jgi:hypothetical protein
MQKHYIKKILQEMYYAHFLCLIYCETYYNCVCWIMCHAGMMYVKYVGLSITGAKLDSILKSSDSFEFKFDFIFKKIKLIIRSKSNLIYPKLTDLQFN